VSNPTSGTDARPGPRIRISNNGPYLVSGAPRLTTRTPVVDMQGDAVAWTEGPADKTRATYVLCRCGQSRDKPFCDGSHQRVGFDGTCTADRAPGATRRKVYAGVGIVMTDDESLCAGYAFCDPHGGVWREIEQTADPAIRARVERQIADCPSGRLQYARSANEAPVETAYPPTVATIPNGALWVLGGVPVETADGFTYEVRNRQLLCRCGASQNKPFCDGSHRRVKFQAP
jgi:CDGSH-type Zn-finger protein